jgi:hypothetical protein
MSARSEDKHLHIGFSLLELSALGPSEQKALPAHWGQDKQ